jgi:hypothetical protein
LAFNDFETHVTVAYLTPDPQFTHMHIVLAVTAHTHPRRLLHEQCFHMALLASYPRMFTFQRIARFPGMVECMSLPICRGVTELAFTSEASLVIIILLVAIITNRGGVFKKQGLVALPTAGLFMFAQKGKVCFLTIKFL